MATRRLKLGDTVLVILGLVALVPLLIARWLSDTLGIPPPVSLIFLLVFVGWLVGRIVVAYFHDKNQKARAIQIANIDVMTGIDFERYLQRLLTAQGYAVQLTRASGDLGVDLIASRNDGNIAIQVKRQEKRISRRAVSDAVAGMQHYRCEKSMVVTNNYFTDGAVTLARSTGCVLIDRDLLARWIVEFQNTAPKTPNVSPSFSGLTSASRQRSTSLTRAVAQHCPACGTLRPWVRRSFDGAIACWKCGRQRSAPEGAQSRVSAKS